MPTGQIRYRSADTGRPKQKQMADARMVDAVFQPSKKSKADVIARNYKAKKPAQKAKETRAAAAKLKAMDKKKADEKAEKQRKLKERQRKLRAKRRR